VPIGVSGTTNILKVQLVGKVLVKGTGIGTGVITGELCVAKTIDELKRKYAKGNILVVPLHHK